jgi:nucleoside-diphosphate-sugar epimerase
MKILVTGGAGFVGRHLIRRLLIDNHSIVCVDNLRSGTGAIHPRDWLELEWLHSDQFEFVESDCRDYFKNRLCEFDEVYHLAAIVGGRAVIEGNPIFVASDLAIDSDMWNFVASNSGTKVIHFSSSAAYPIELQREDTWRNLVEADIDFDSFIIGKPDLSYGWAKLTSEFIGKLAYNSKGIKSVTYRPFSGYGSDQDGNYPFRAICERAIALDRSARSFEVWGSGNQIRDFIHIEDCISGVLQTKDKIFDGSAVNLATGIGTSFKSLAAIVLKELDFEDVEIQGISDKPEGVFSRVGSIDYAKSLGFVASKTLHEGIREAISALS